MVTESEFLRAGFEVYSKEKKTMGIYLLYMHAESLWGGIHGTLIKTKWIA